MLRQVERELSRRENIGGSEWARLAKTKQELQESYRRGLDQLEALAPYARDVAGKYGLQGVVSDFTRAQQEYASRGTTEIRDGIFTAAEIEVLLRTTVLRPEPQYRLGHVVGLNLARAGLLDPTWQQTMKPALIRRITAGFTGAFLAANAADGVMPVDIEADGPEGEYEPLGPEPDATETL